MITNPKATNAECKDGGQCGVGGYCKGCHQPLTNDTERLINMAMQEGARRKAAEIMHALGSGLK